MRVRVHDNVNRAALAVIPGQQNSQDTGSPRRVRLDRQIAERKFAACIVLINGADESNDTFDAEQVGRRGQQPGGDLDLERVQPHVHSVHDRWVDVADIGVKDPRAVEVLEVKRQE